MEVENIKNILKEHRLKLTSPRSKVLEVLFSSDRALTYSEIMATCARTVDRVTVYRTLKLFEEIGLIHRITGVNDMPNYALSIRADGTPQPIHQQHLHFYCTCCQGVFCLQDHDLPALELPERYQVHSMNLTITGLCSACNLRIN